MRLGLSETLSLLHFSPSHSCACMEFVKNPVDSKKEHIAIGMV